MRTLTRTQTIASIAAGLATMAASGAPEYKVDHFIDTYNSTVHAPGGDVGPQGTPIDYSFPFQSVHWQDKNWGEVYAKAGPGSVGVYARAWNNGQYAPQRQEVYARFGFDVVFSSTGTDPVNVILNLDVAGDIAGGNQSLSTALVRAWAPAYGPIHGGDYGEYNDNGSIQVTRSGMLSGFTADGTYQNISSGTFFGIPVNSPVRFYIQIGSVQGYWVQNPTVSFGDTLRLSTTGNVFTLSGAGAASVTSVDSVDAGIVGNSYAPPCDGDADANGVVDVNDVAYVIFRLGATGTPGAVDGDADGNGTVDVNDIAYVIFRLGAC